MNFLPTAIQDCYIIEPRKIEDHRGYFMESFNSRAFYNATGLEVNFVQDNQSFSSKGTLRGLHYQCGEHAQAKLVRVLQGEVLDVAVDLRPDSPSFGKHISVILSESNNRQLYIPRGFAHGFAVLSNTATFFYKCDNFYNKESEGGIYYADPVLNIDWKLDESSVTISEKDKELPLLNNARKVW